MPFPRADVRPDARHDADAVAVGDRIAAMGPAQTFQKAASAAREYGFDGAFRLELGSHEEIVASLGVDVGGAYTVFVIKLRMFFESEAARGPSQNIRAAALAPPPWAPAAGAPTPELRGARPPIAAAAGRDVRSRVLRRHQHTDIQRRQALGRARSRAAACAPGRHGRRHAALRARGRARPRRTPRWRKRRCTRGYSPVCVTPVGAAGLLAPASDLRSVALRGVDGMSASRAVVQWHDHALRGGGPARARLGPVVLALRGIDGMAVVALWFGGTPRPSGRRACSRPPRTCGP